MADPRQITELPVATSADDEDIALIRQGTYDKQATLDKLRAPLLRAANNLSDLADAAEARENLGLTNMDKVLVDSGAADAYAVSGSGLSSYSDTDNLLVRISHANTGACTLEAESLGAKAIVLPDGSDPAAGVLVAEGIYLFVYDADGDGGTGAWVIQTVPAAGVAYDDTATQTNAGNVQNALDHLQTIYTDTGAADAYVITPNPAITGYAAGQIFRVAMANDNTGACTLNVNAKGTKSIKTTQGEDPESGSIKAGTVLSLIYDGTNFQVVSGAYPVRMKTVTWTGDDNTTQAITGVGFSPKFVKAYVQHQVGTSTVVQEAIKTDKDSTKTGFRLHYYSIDPIRSQ